jgi:ketosteroid isomerase-like protein
MNKLVFLLSSLIIITSCNNQSNNISTKKVNNSSDSIEAIKAILKADILWDSISAKNSAEGWVSFYSNDAIMMPPGESACTDNASRLSSIKNMFALPGAKMRFQGTKTEVSKSGDLGYSAGVYQFEYKDTNGKDVHENGKWCETWKKQDDGNWKCIVDIWNADPAK